MKVSEPAAAYGRHDFQGLKNRLIAAIDNCSDEERLRDCLDTLDPKMPCVFNDEEFKEEIRLSEASGDATDEEVADMFVKWGIVV